MSAAKKYTATTSVEHQSISVFNGITPNSFRSRPLLTEPVLGPCQRQVPGVQAYADAPHKRWAAVCADYPMGWFWMWRLSR